MAQRYADPPRFWFAARIRLLFRVAWRPRYFPSLLRPPICQRRDVKTDDLQNALVRLIERLRERMGPRAASDLLESYAWDLAAEADRLESDQDDSTA